MIELQLSKSIFNEAYYKELTRYDRPVEVYYGGS